MQASSRPSSSGPRALALFRMCAIALCSLGLAPALAAQDSAGGPAGGQGWIHIEEPREWGGEGARGIQVASRRAVRVVGLAHHPAGVRQVMIDGQRAAVSPQPDGSVRFTGYAESGAEAREVEIGVYGGSGPPLVKRYGLAASQEPAPAASAEQALQQSGFRGERWAVVVGVSEYEDAGNITPLRYADDDAQAFYNFLTSDRAGLGGFPKQNVRLLLNADATFLNLRDALFDFLKSATPEDVVVIYFAGHGAPDPERPDRYYLLTHDTDARRIASTAFPMADVENVVRHTHARDKIVIMDACHSAGAGGQVALRSGQVNAINQHFLHQLESSSGAVAIFTASGVNEYSQEDERWGGGHGVFTYHLLEGLYGAADEDADAVVTLGEAVVYTQDKVRRATRNAQVPSISQTAFDRSWPMAVVTTPGAVPSVGESVAASSGEAAASPPPAPAARPDATPAVEAAPSAMAAPAASARVALLSPGGAAMRSLLVPGLGQFYTGRPVIGTALLGATAGALAWGVMSESRTVECLARMEGGACPDGREGATFTTRPYLVAGAGAAAALAVIAAWDGLRAARRINADRLAARRSGAQAALPASTGRESTRLLPPALDPTADGLGLALVRVRF